MQMTIQYQWRNGSTDDSYAKSLFHRKEHKDHKEIEWKSLCSLRSLWLTSAFCRGVTDYTD